MMSKPARHVLIPKGKTRCALLLGWTRQCRESYCGYTERSSSDWRVKSVMPNEQREPQCRLKYLFSPMLALVQSRNGKKLLRAKDFLCGYTIVTDLMGRVGHWRRSSAPDRLTLNIALKISII